MRDTLMHYMFWYSVTENNSSITQTARAVSPSPHTLTLTLTTLITPDTDCLTACLTHTPQLLLS